jgi:hypothetical protein
VFYDIVVGTLQVDVVYLPVQVIIQVIHLHLFRRNSVQGAANEE